MYYRQKVPPSRAGIRNQFTTASACREPEKRQEINRLHPQTGDCESIKSQMTHYLESFLFLYDDKAPEPISGKEKAEKAPLHMPNQIHKVLQLAAWVFVT
jgi:hypothetical protein